MDQVLALAGGIVAQTEESAVNTQPIAPGAMIMLLAIGTASVLGLGSGRVLP
jgi:hypothetical protein